MKALDGYKTYLVAAAMVAVAFYLNATQQIDANRMIELVLEGLGLGAVRHAIARK